MREVEHSSAYAALRRMFVCLWRICNIPHWWSFIFFTHINKSMCTEFPWLSLKYISAGQRNEMFAFFIKVCDFTMNIKMNSWWIKCFTKKNDYISYMLWKKKYNKFSNAYHMIEHINTNGRRVCGKLCNLG